MIFGPFRCRMTWPHLLHEAHLYLLIMQHWCFWMHGHFFQDQVADLLDPSMHANRAAVERHHLFPKGFLNKKSITGIRDTNQITNYAYVEWGDNVDISDQAPADYLPRMKEQFSQKEFERMYRLHALPENWEKLDYDDFLEKRRELMAQVIADGYSTLIAEKNEETMDVLEFDLSKIVLNGESGTVGLNQPCGLIYTLVKDPRMELAVLKTIAGFLNTNGGILIIGLTDEGTQLISSG